MCRDEELEEGPVVVVGVRIDCLRAHYNDPSVKDSVRDP